MTQLSFHSPLGDLTVTEEGAALVSLDWGWAAETGTSPLLRRARDQLLGYLDGKRRDFNLPLAPRGTAFQLRVWKALQTIPYGQTRTYGELARKLKTAPRPLGGACGRNPIPLIIPCHRVLAGGGALGGYSGADGIETKRFLLDLEAKKRS